MDISNRWQKRSIFHYVLSWEEFMWCFWCYFGWRRREWVEALLWRVWWRDGAHSPLTDFRRTFGPQHDVSPPQKAGVAPSTSWTFGLTFHWIQLWFSSQFISDTTELHSCIRILTLWNAERLMAEGLMAERQLKIPKVHYVLWEFSIWKVT